MNSLVKRLGDDFVWGLKYRPKNIDGLILPKSLKEQINKIINSGNIPNMLFYGSAGVGKTSTAAVIADMLQTEYLYINGSEETGMDVLRVKINQFVTSTNWDNKKKIVIIDEADRMLGKTQDAMKSAIETFSKGCSFIFISNHKNKIIPPLQSRLQAVSFQFSKAEIERTKKDFFKAVLGILETEEVKYNKKVIANIVQKIFPDMRKCLNELQRLAQQELLESEDILAIVDNESEYFNVLKNKKVVELKNFIANINSDPQTFYSQLYDTFGKYVEQKSIPEFIMLLNRYSYEAAFVTDSRINLMSFSMDALINCEFKEDL